jgi:hypothetical protein
MRVKQLSVFIENKVGRVAEITSLLGEHNINIRGFAVADTAEYGILRLIVADPDRAASLLRSHNFTLNESEVICIDVPDKPGGLASVLKIFSENNLNIEYMYSIVKTAIVFSVTEIDKALNLIKSAGFKILEQKDIAKL